MTPEWEAVFRLHMLAALDELLGSSLPGLSVEELSAGRRVVGALLDRQDVEDVLFGASLRAHDELVGRAVVFFAGHRLERLHSVEVVFDHRPDAPFWRVGAASVSFTSWTGRLRRYLVVLTPAAP